MQNLENSVRTSFFGANNCVGDTRTVKINKRECVFMYCHVVPNKTTNLLKSAEINVSKLISFDSVVIFLSTLKACFAAWNLIFSLPASFLKSTSYVSTCLSSRPLDYSFTS